MRLLFTVTLFVSAMLLFLVQPMVGKMLLPLAGGTPAVWNTCMVFFQAALLAGYYYAHRSTVRLGARGQSALHVPLLLLPLLVLIAAALFTGSPLHAFKSLAPSGQQYPFFNIVLLLTVMVGLPFFFVSTTAPLLQGWFADTTDPAAKDPYFLYAASNLGSFLGLILYPLVIERYLTLNQQAWLFGAGFGGWVALIAICANKLRRAPEPVRGPEFSTAPPSWADRIGWMCLAAVPSSLMLSVTTFATTDLAPIPLFFVVPLGIYLLTFVVAFGIRWDWVYLLNSLLFPMLLLVIVFLKTTKADEFLPLAVGRALLRENDLSGGMKVLCYIVFHVVVFTVIALGCHFELARRRPNATRLTEFFLWVSLGGVLGGLFNALVAPMIFIKHTEYVVGILAASFVIPHGGSMAEDSPARRNRGAWTPIVFGLVLLLGYRYFDQLAEHGPLRDLLDWVAKKEWTAGPALVKSALCFIVAALACLLTAPRASDVLWPMILTWSVFLLVGGYDAASDRQPLTWIRDWLNDRNRGDWFQHIKTICCFGVPALICFAFVERPVRFGLAVCGVFLTGVALNEEAKPLFAGRSFFGTLEVTESWDLDQQKQRLDTGSHMLTHGTTTHGMQHVTVDRAQNRKFFTDDPLTYYHRDGPIGDIFAHTPLRNSTEAIAFIGLGTGSLASYGKPHQSVTFYEIDPLVRRIAENEELFRYLSMAKQRNVKVQFAMGDARLKLEEAPDDSYAFIAVDAFSSDSIPVHLLTREAVQLYFQKLKPNGIVALHVSNRYLDLSSVVAQIARDLKLEETTYQWHDGLEDNSTGRYRSDWIVLTRERSALGDLLVQVDERAEPRWKKLTEEYKQGPLWTDDYSNIFSVFNWN